MKLNCDVGEGDVGEGLVNIDALLMPHLDMASIACGGHAGNSDSMRSTVALAKQYGVCIGAHPSYPDRQNFGRKSLQLPPEKLLESLAQQVEELCRIAEQHNTRVSFIKPHGALYNDCVIRIEVREVMLRLADNFDLPLMLQALPAMPRYQDYHQQLHGARQRVIFEAFADRAYDNEGRLLARSQANAVHETLNQCQAQITRLLAQQRVISDSGELLTIDAQALCVHSDSPSALATVKAVREILDAR